MPFFQGKYQMILHRRDTFVVVYTLLNLSIPTEPNNQFIIGTLLLITQLEYVSIANIKYFLSIFSQAQLAMTRYHLAYIAHS